MTHSSDVFYNRITFDIVNYNDLKALYPITWPSDYQSVGVDGRIADTNPPNGLLDTYPTIGDWERLYRDPQPVVKMWEIAEMDAVAFNGGTSRYEQTWTIRARDANEMITINTQVQIIAENQRLDKLYEAAPIIEYNGVKAEAGSGPFIAEKIGQLSSQDDITTINWEGPNDPLTGVSEWFDATLGDFQGLAVVPLPDSEKGFAAKRAVMAVQLVTPYDTEQDVIDAFNNFYDEE